MDRTRLPSLPFDGAGLISDRADVWIMRLVRRADREGWGFRKLEREIRGYGSPLSPNEKRALGLRANVRIGRTYLNCLTARGRANPILAADELVYRNLIVPMIQRNSLRARSYPVDTLQFIVVDSVRPRPCKAALRMAGRRFPTAEIPELPLPGCDSRCACFYGVTVEGFE